MIKRNDRIMSLIMMSGSEHLHTHSCTLIYDLSKQQAKQKYKFYYVFVIMK